MQVDVLGPLRVWQGDTPAELGGPRLRALLTRLAVDAGRVVPVDVLAEAVWPDGVPAHPVEALHSQISRLRRVFPGPVHSKSGGYVLALDPDDVDLHRFERLAREGRELLRKEAADEALQTLDEALRLWRGDPLPDAGAAPYAVAAVARLEEVRLAAVEDRIAARLPTEPGRLIPALHELVAAHPLRERPHALLIRALHADGRNAEALAAYEEIKERLAAELGADPGPDLRQAHAEALTEAPAQGKPRGNLPAPLTTFVGRGEERSMIEERLAAARLVTLVGPGGVGKTRLATTAAAEASVAGGVWLIELAEATGPDDVPDAVAGVLGTGEPFGVGRDRLTRLAEVLSARETLLILDNCEHVADAAAGLAHELLGRCPRLTILATSREPLGVPGEALVPVLPLDADDAIRLFADRAAAVRPGFEISPDNSGTVREICRRLDGLPLAIELAAARLRAMPLDRLAARLEDRFAVLAGGSRTALPRHRTLRAVVEWSWEMLTDEERMAAERLAVFPAAFSAEAAESVGAAPPVLDALVDRSLLRLDGDRYRMLETIREYALGRAANAAEARAAHAAYFLDLAERAAPHLTGAGQLPWIALLNAERANLLAALNQSVETEDAATAIRLGAALSYFWTIRNEHTEAVRHLGAALRAPGEAPAEAGAVATAGYLLNAALAGELTRADAPAKRLAGHPATVMADALGALASGDAGGGLAVLDRAPEADPWTSGIYALIRVFLQSTDGYEGPMQDTLLTAAELFREAGERWGLATTLTYAGLTLGTFGRLDEALATLQEALGVARELGSGDLQQVWLANIRMGAGEIDAARAELLGVVADGESAFAIATAHMFLADMARHGGDLAEAARELKHASDPGLTGDVTFEAVHASGTGRLAIAEGNLEAGAASLHRAVELGEIAQDPGLVALAGVGAVQLIARRGERTPAAELFGAIMRGNPVGYDPDVARIAAELRSALGDRAYHEAYTRGSDLSPQDTVTLLKDQLRRR